MTTTSASRTLAWLRQFAKLWGFALFCVLVVYIFREVVLPFLFAILVAYILAPLVARSGRVRIGGRPFPRWAAVIILYVFILSGLGWFIGYFVPKLSGDFARLFREAPQLFAKVNKDWLPRAGAWIDTHFAPEEVDPGDDLTSHAEEPQAPRAIVVEPLSDGRYRIDLDAVNIEVRPLENGKVPDRAARPGPARRGRGREVGAFDQAVARDPAEVHRGREPARARVRPEVHRRGRVRHRAPVPGADGRGVHPDRSRSYPGHSSARWSRSGTRATTTGSTSASTADCRASSEGSF